LLLLLKNRPTGIAYENWGIFARNSVATELTLEAGSAMELRPSENCEHCFWWYEDPFLRKGCATNLSLEIKGKDRAVGMLGTLRKRVTVALS
jgi:hypothetical protein